MYVLDARDLLESQALSRTPDRNCNYDENEEQRTAPPYQRAESPFHDEFDSDWDDWEDGEEVAFVFD